MYWKPFHGSAVFHKWDPVGSLTSYPLNEASSLRLRGQLKQTTLNTSRRTKTKVKIIISEFKPPQPGDNKEQRQWEKGTWKKQKERTTLQLQNQKNSLKCYMSSLDGCNFNIKNHTQRKTHICTHRFYCTIMSTITLCTLWFFYHQPITPTVPADSLSLCWPLKPQL